MNKKGLKWVPEVGLATTDPRAEERQSASRVQRHFSPASLSLCVSSRPLSAARKGARAAALRIPRGAEEMAPSEMAPARLPAARRSRERKGRRHHHAAAGSVTRHCPAGHKGDARRLETRRSGWSRSALAPWALRPPPKAERPRCGASAPQSASAAASAQAAARSALSPPAIILNRSSPWA